MQWLTPYSTTWEWTLGPEQFLSERVLIDCVGIVTLGRNIFPSFKLSMCFFALLKHVHHMAPSPPPYYICPQRGQDSVLLLPHQSRLIAFCLKENLTEYSCFIMLLVSAVQKSECAICLHISLFWLSFPFRSWQSTESSSLCWKLLRGTPCLVGTNAHYWSWTCCLFSMWGKSCSTQGLAALFSLAILMPLCRGHRHADFSPW